MNEYTLITGASRGIGKAIALTFSKKGHNLIIVSKHNYDDLLIVKSLCELNGTICHAYSCDISDYSQVNTLKENLTKLHINITCLINNAGISYFGLIQDMDISDWNNIINTNLSSVFYTCKSFVPEMIAKQKGCIINISSVWGNIGASCEVAYSASKGGVNAFTKALSRELAPSHINVNAIACGAIDTSMNSRLSNDERADLENEIPYGRMGFDSEVATLAYNIYKSPDYLTGQIITLDGAWT